MKQLLWADRKRIFGMPISFTRYYLYEDKLIHSRGLLLTKEGEILLYRVMDVEIKYSLLDRLLGIGTIVLYGVDVSESVFPIQKIRNPREVLNKLNELIEKERIRIGVKGTEVYGSMHSPSMYGR